MNTHKRSYIVFLEKLLPLIFILPYAEISLIQDKFDLKESSSYLPASVFLVLVFTFFYLISFPKKNNCTFKEKRIISLLYIASIYLILQNIIMSMTKLDMPYTTTMYQMLHIVVPLLCTVVIYKFIIFNNVNTQKFFSRGIALFSFYLIICSIINIAEYGFSFNDGSRLISPGGGATILGYSISLVLALIYCKKPLSRKRELICSSILLIATFLTGTRGGIWPSIVIFLFILLNDKNKNINIILFCFLMCIVLVVGILAVPTDFAPRFFSTESVNRMATFSNSLLVFKDFSFFEKIFGKGLGNFFPYQQWRVLSLSGWVSNVFTFSGVSLLVEPHNTYVMSLLETGIFGLALLIIFLILIFSLVKDIEKSSRFRYIVIWALFSLLCVIESTIFIQPAVCFLWLIILLVSMVDDKQHINKFSV